MEVIKNNHNNTKKIQETNTNMNIRMNLLRII